MKIVLMSCLTYYWCFDKFSFPRENDLVLCGESLALSDQKYASELSAQLKPSVDCKTLLRDFLK